MINLTHTSAHGMGNTTNGLEVVEGIGFQPAYPPDTITWVDICSNGTMWVMVGFSGTTIYFAHSTDLITWTSAGGSTITAGDGNPSGIACNGTTFVVIMSGQRFSTVTQAVYVSTNGTTWAKYSTGYLGNWTGICSDGTGFTLISTPYSIYTHGYSICTLNGTTFNNPQALPTTGTYDWYAITSDGTHFVVIGDIGDSAYASSYGGAWNMGTGLSSLAINAVTTNGSVYVAVGNNSVSYSTNNGVSWSYASIPMTLDLRGVTSNGDIFVASPFNDHFLISSKNGIDWSLYTAPYRTGDITIACNGLPFNNVGNLLGAITSQSGPGGIYPSGATPVHISY